MSPPAEVHLSKKDDASELSSVLQTVTSSQVATMFPCAATPKSFDKSSFLFHILDEVCSFDNPSLNRLETLGWSTPHMIANNFGLNNQTVTRSFATMGLKHVLPQEMEVETAMLLVFARSQTIQHRVTRSNKQQAKSWDHFQRKLAFNFKFESMHEQEKEWLLTFLIDGDAFLQAKKEMKTVRKLIRSWVRAKPSPTSPLAVEPSVHTPRDDQSLSMQSIKQSVEAIEGKMDKKSDSVLRDVQQSLHQVVASIPGSVEKQVQSVMQQHLQ